MVARVMGKLAQAVFQFQGLMTVRREHSRGWLEQESLYFRFQHFFFFFFFFQTNRVVMIITASGFSSENQEKHVLAWHGEIKTINIPCLEVSCLSGAVLQEGQHRSF